MAKCRGPNGSHRFDCLPERPRVRICVDCGRTEHELEDPLGHLAARCNCDEPPASTEQSPGRRVIGTCAEGAYCTKAGRCWNYRAQRCAKECVQLAFGCIHWRAK
jgi:hypothetical protein